MHMGDNSIHLAPCQCDIRSPVRRSSWHPCVLHSQSDCGTRTARKNDLLRTSDEVRPTKFVDPCRRPPYLRLVALATWLYWLHMITVCIPHAPGARMTVVTETPSNYCTDLSSPPRPPTHPLIPNQNPSGVRTSRSFNE